MRLPGRKVYRAFREFDRMSDEECRRYMLGLVHQGRLRLWKSIVVFVLAVPLLVVPVLCGVLWLAHGPGSGVVSWMDKVEFGPGLSLAVVLFGVLIPLIGWGLPHGAALIARDLAIRRALKKQISTAACGRCRQSLIGLPLIYEDDDVRVRCPECGNRWSLRAIGLVEDDIRPGSEGSHG